MIGSMPSEHSVQTLAEILESEETLQQAADDFANFSLAQEKNDDDMNNGIESCNDFLNLLDKIEIKSPDFYRDFCRLGADD